VGNSLRQPAASARSCTFAPEVSAPCPGAAQIPESLRGEPVAAYVAGEPLRADRERYLPQRREARLLECHLLVVETSMVDVLLVKNLPRVLPANASHLMVGEVDQLSRSWGQAWFFGA